MENVSRLCATRSSAPLGPRKRNERSGGSVPVAYFFTCRLWCVSRRATRKRSIDGSPLPSVRLSASPVARGPPGTRDRSISGSVSVIASSEVEKTWRDTEHLGGHQL